MKSLKKVVLGFALAAGLLAAHTATAQKDPDVGGAPMYPTKTIVENAVNSPIHKTLVAAVKAAGLVDTLNSAGPFTVFAPTDDAFAKLPAGTVDTLTQPDNKATLTKILTYHVVKGRISSKDLAKMINKGMGRQPSPQSKAERSSERRARAIPLLPMRRVAVQRLPRQTCFRATA